ncbi:MAG: RagB/SusD family nutrient uptake outer membrane protein [Candidatus Cryptobacteroides sp.]|jgi:hypothetical protein
MKLLLQYISIAAIIVTSFGFGACTDRLSFGNDFLEKAPGGTVTADTVFTNAEYTRQFLAGIYSRQYYALPTNSTNSPPQCLNYWKGMPDALSDNFQLFFMNTIVGNKYYSGSLTSETDSRNNGNIYPFKNEYIWENVRNCYLLLENIDRASGLDPAEIERMKDETRCLLASTYFITFRHYGGLPLITGTFTGSESEYNLPRASVKETVDFMVDLLDEVIQANRLPWGYTGADAASETGRWTLAGAMALKCKILQFAASPLFNDSKSYFDGRYALEDPLVAWYGGYDAEHWNRFKKACEDFLEQMNAKGIYHLVVPAGKTTEDYRFAFRSSYLFQGSPEVIMGIRVAKTAHGNDYGWINLRTNPRMSYCPTQEYVEMFPWADGRPFNWEETKRAGKLDHMFVQGDTVGNNQMLQNRKYTRDPRLYETVAVNGALQTINWGNGNSSGANYELWVGGTTAGQSPINQDSHYGTGYRFLKYYAGEAFLRKYPQWIWLSLGEIYLGYAEALVQTGNNAKAIEYVDAMRARVGLGGLVECNPDKNLLSDKNALLEEILRERACEFAFNDSRYFDMIRYKRADLFERPLHRLLIYRLVKNDSGQWERSETQWYNVRQNAKEGTPAYYEPSHFDYELQEITVGKRYWWTHGFDPKWYLQPFPVTEVNKGYGLTQNAGW